MKIKRDIIDTLFSQYIRQLADFTCEYCGQKKSKMECSHFHSRRKKSVRWDYDNAACLCFSCHTYLGGNPYAHTKWFEKRLGSQRFEQLNIRAEMLLKVTPAVREQITADIKKHLESISQW